MSEKTQNTITEKNTEKENNVESELDRREN